MDRVDSTAAARLFSARFCAEGVSVSRGGARIVSNISITLEPGDVVILRGPNGSGKTTLLRAFAGLLRIDDGAIRVESAHGSSVSAPVDEPSASLIYCGPQNAAKAALTVDENLRFWAALYDAPEGALETARTAFRLEGYADRLAGALSTGLFRRLGLSRLVLARRPIWFVDEPTASLDASSSETFARYVEDHRAAGGVAVIATHDAFDIAGARKLRLAEEQAA